MDDTSNNRDGNNGTKDERRGETNKESCPIEIAPKRHAPKFGVACCSNPGGSTSGGSNQDEPTIPLDKIIKTANTMSSMMMAHRIALEDDFRLEPGMDISGPLMSLSPIIGSSPSKGLTSGTGTSEPSLRNRVKDIVHEAYWDLFNEELQSQKSDTKEDRKYDISKQLLCDIKQKLLDLLLPQHTRLREEIEDKLDANILAQLIKVHSLDLLDYALYILSVLSKLCAPVRDEKIRELRETTDIIQVYRGILELLELMRLDFANFTLNRFKPHIKAHSMEYEREKFNELFKQQQAIGIDGLEYTSMWLSRAVDKVDEQYGLSDLINNSELDGLGSSSIMTYQQADRESNSVVTQRDRILQSDVFTKVLNTAYCELLEWKPEKQKLYPETLLFDEATFKQLGEQYKVLVLTSSILLTVFAFVSRFKLHDNNDFRILVKSHTITLLTASYDDQSQESSKEHQKSNSSVEDRLTDIKLQTIISSLQKDIRQKLEDIDKSLIAEFETQKELLAKQILDLQNSSNRVKELARRRILEFVENLLTIDAKHQQDQLAKMAPPVNIPLGMNCLADEITLTMSQLVKIIRYNRKVFFQHYQDLIVNLVMKKL